MSGLDKLPLLLIGKSKKPRGFKNVTSLPITYESNSKAWMTKPLFGKWLTKLDAKLMKENKKVILLIDNCSAHYADSSYLINIKIVFLPPNTTSVMQPLDAGIIKNMKHFYRKKILQII